MKVQVIERLENELFELRLSHKEQLEQLEGQLAELRQQLAQAHATTNAKESSPVRQGLSEITRYSHSHHTESEDGDMSVLLNLSDTHVSLHLVEKMKQRHEEQITKLHWQMESEIVSMQREF